MSENLGSSTPNWQSMLSGPRITLRPLLREDFESLYAVASDPLLWEQHPNPDRYKREVFEGFFELAMASKGALAVIRNADSKIVGSSRFYDFREAERDVVIGFTFLARECWGGSLNAELKSLMLNHAFRFVDRVEFHVGPKNNRSQRALAKIGARSLGERDRPVPGGGVTRSAVFELTAEDLLKNGGLGFRIVVDVPTQGARFIHGEETVAQFQVSTSAVGVGNEAGSNRTPPGVLRVEGRIGDDVPTGTIFRGRVSTGEVFAGGESESTSDADADAAEDLVLTRILWLGGIERENANTRERLIYLHGTNQENLLGTPASHGCIRFRNRDILTLFACTPLGTRVEIIE